MAIKQAKLASTKYGKDKPTPVIAVEDFAHRKGVTKGLLSYRERKEKKRLEKAKALRSYKKVMKKEGYEPGTGASRKRPDQVHEKTVMNDNTGSTKDAQKAHVETGNRKPRTHRFQKSVQSAEQFKDSREISKKEKQQHENERRAALKERRQRSKMLSARTKKGQPIMANIAKDILNKLQKESK